MSKFNVNLKFRITEINKNMVTLENVATGLQQEINLKKLRQNFIYASCYTCHKMAMLLFTIGCIITFLKSGCIQQSQEPRI